VATALSSFDSSPSVRRRDRIPATRGPFTRSPVMEVFASTGIQGRRASTPTPATGSGSSRRSRAPAKGFPRLMVAPRFAAAPTREARGMREESGEMAARPFAPSGGYEADPHARNVTPVVRAQAVGQAGRYSGDHRFDGLTSRL
jgi:hypothetical protein